MLFPFLHPFCLRSLCSLRSSSRTTSPWGILKPAFRVVTGCACTALLGLAALAMAMSALGQAGQTIDVANGDVAGLITAIQTLNANGGGSIDLASGGTYSVTQPSDWWFGPNAFPAIASSITINGNGDTISRASGSPKFPSGSPKFRFFYVSGGFSTLPAGSLTLNNLTLSGGLAQGGSGGAGVGGGGGGAGLGGAIYNQGTLNLSSVTLTGNSALGGSAGAGNAGEYAGGAGGGLGGNGADSNGGNSAAGGGGGFKEDGVMGPEIGYGGSGGSFLGNEGGGNGNAGLSNYGGNGGDGLQCGGGGGGGFEAGENGGVPSPQGSGADFQYEGGSGAQGGGQGGASSDGGTGCGGGGGAFGGGGGGGYGAGTSDGAGGAGGVGGGGGGGGFNGGGGSGGFGGGGSGGAGTSYVGNGGFGGGGGGSYFYSSAAAGTSTFGGGAGISSSGATGANGGGGAGFGGAIFNHLGTAIIASSVFTSNSAAGASGGGTANGFGGAIFNLNGTVLLSGITYADNTAVDSTGTADNGAFFYNLSHSAGSASSSQTPSASLVLIETTLSTANGDLVSHQVNGTAAVTGYSAPVPVAVITPVVLTSESLWPGYLPPAQTATLTSLDAPLSISNVALGTGAGFVINSNNCPSSLSAGASCQVSVSFTGTAAATNTLTFTTNSAVNPTQVVQLNGVFPAQPAATQLVFLNAPSTTWVGQGGTLNVLEETPDGTQQYSSTDIITLTVTDQNMNSRTYTATAVHGMASFNLPGAPSTSPNGVLTYTASAPNLSSASATTAAVAPTVGSPAGMSTVSVTIANAGVLNSIQVLTQGVVGLDFTADTGGTCAIGTYYNAGQACTVNVDFTPSIPGMRYGAVVLQDGSGNPLATSYFQDEGFGPQINYLPGAQVSVVNSAAVGQAEGVAVDGAGNVYVVDSSSYALLKSTFSGGSYSTNPLSTSTPSGTNEVAVDGAGNIYFNDFGNNRILKETPVSSGYTESSITSSSLQDPCGVAIDGGGSVYIADSASNQVYKETPSGGTYTESTVPVSNPTYPSVTCGVAVDGSGNVYISDVYNGRLLKETLSGESYTESTLPIPAGTDPAGVAVDPVGNVYFFIANNNVQYTPVYKDTLTSSNTYTMSTVPTSGICYPAGLAVDGSGNVYVSDGGGCSAAVLKEDFADLPTLNFPTSTLIGTLDTTDGAQTETILNSGNQPLVFTSPSTGSNPSYPSNFPANSSDSNLCSSVAPLDPGVVCDVSVNFQPTAVGANSGSIVLTDNALNAANATQSIAISGTGAPLLTQAITFTPPASPVYYGVAPIKLVATGGASGNPVTFSIVSGPGSLSGPNNIVLTVTGAGSIVIAANQAGSPGYAAAEQVTASITVLQSVPAAITAPASGSTLTGPTVTFTWSAGTGVTQYDLHVGTAGVGSSNIFAGTVTGQSKTITGIPTTGGTLNVRLYSLINGAWQSVDYTYTEASPAAPATMTSPTPGSTLTLSSATFSWTAGSQVTQYDLHVGTTGVGSSNIFAGTVAGQSKTLTGIPTTGGTLNVRLYSLISGAWQYIDYTYTEASPAAPATMTSPTPGSTLTASTVTLSWTTGSLVTQYDLHVGTTGVGSSNIFAGTVTGQSKSLTGIPVTGGTLNVRLYSLISGAWQYNDYSYTEYTMPVPAAMISPTPSSTLTGSSVTFSWTTGTLVTQYDLHVGTTGVGSSNIFAGTVAGASKSMTGIPTTGGALNVRLYSLIKGAWQYIDYTYTEQ